MSRIADCFARARAERRKALVIYLTASDPDGETSLRLLQEAAGAGADIIEIGVPWSDPSADGPAIQAAMHRALAAGGGLRSTLAICKLVRQKYPLVGLVLFGYANPIVVMGPEVFALRAADAGADAVLCVDYPPDADRELTSALIRQGLDFIPLLAPTSTPPRIAAAAAVASGFIYYVSLTGITGTKLEDLEAPRGQVESIRVATSGKVPVVVGFGIKTPADARAIASFADGVVVGSAAIQLVERAIAAGRDPVPELGAFVRSLRDALASSPL
ncbi:MAG TPA: tryptophan synthase subunit alpha [Polyangia bacterium]|nr:tryptophan synthase subunit alpha [Polyangia bacterium]